MVPSSDRICIHYILLEEENTMIINVFLKANTRANTKYYGVMHLSQNRVKLNIIHGTLGRIQSVPHPQKQQRKENR